jgi:predicted nucleic acid-binding protein
VEVHSAVARLHRNGYIDEIEKQGALARLNMLRRGWREILPEDELRNVAGQLLDTYELRAAASLQLAAALTWCQQRPAQKNFISGDQRLCDAAETAGFIVIRLPR